GGGGGGALDRAGVDALWSRACDLDRAYDGHEPTRRRVLLAHNPRTVERLGGRRCDLMLSGHTHGGQVNWPGLGRVTLGRKARRFAAGLYRHGQTHLYVNKGVGFGWRFRFGVRPEVAGLTLRPVPNPWVWRAGCGNRSPAAWHAARRPVILTKGVAPARPGVPAGRFGAPPI